MWFAGDAKAVLLRLTSVASVGVATPVSAHVAVRWYLSWCERRAAAEAWEMHGRVVRCGQAGVRAGCRTGCSQRRGTGTVSHCPGDPPRLQAIDVTAHPPTAAVLPRAAALPPAFTSLPVQICPFAPIDVRRQSIWVLFAIRFLSRRFPRVESASARRRYSSTRASRSAG